MRRCAKERVDPPWPRTARDAADAGFYARRWWSDGASPPLVQWWDVSDPLRARLRHIIADECDEHIRCTSTPTLRDHLREPVALPSPAEAAPAAAERGR